MVSAIRKELPMDATPTIFDKANLLASEFAARAAQHDRDASFPVENFDRLSEAGLLALTVPAALGGTGAGALDAARIIDRKSTRLNSSHSDLSRMPSSA